MQLITIPWIPTFRPVHFRRWNLIFYFHTSLTLEKVRPLLSIYLAFTSRLYYFEVCVQLAWLNSQLLKAEVAWIVVADWPRCFKKEKRVIQNLQRYNLSASFFQRCYYKWLQNFFEYIYLKKRLCWAILCTCLWSKN